MSDFRLKSLKGATAENVQKTSSGRICGFKRIQFWRLTLLTSSELMSTSVKSEDVTASGKMLLLLHTDFSAYLLSEASVKFLFHFLLSLQAL